MQAYSNFQQRINDILDPNSSLTVDKAIVIKQLEQEARDLCLSFDTKIQFLNDRLHEKNDELIKTINERFILTQELNTTKDSARTIIKVLNASLKASSH